MRVNSFVRLRKSSGIGRPKLIVEDLGDAEKVLEDKRHMHRRAQQLVKSGVLADEVPSWGGWLGRYQARLHGEIAALHAPVHPRGRRPLGSPGRL